MSHRYIRSVEQSTEIWCLADYFPWSNLYRRRHV
nr:MAG TPA: hypothetical protein [Caudoviricetes sp.]